VYWQTCFDLISKEYGWTDRIILNLPYFRFCQIMESINRRLVGEQKFDLRVKEITTKFLASILVVGSFLNKSGKTSLLEQVNEFCLLEEEKVKEKLPSFGSFERLMKVFGGKR